MPAPAQTPFDITDIPHIAWVPSMYVWAGAFVVILFAALLGAAFSRSKTPRARAGKLLQALVRDLERTCAGGTTAHAARALLIAKRIAAVTCEPLCAQMSPDELRNRARTTSEPIEIALFNGLAHLEEALYQEPSALRDSRIAEHLCALGRLGSELVSARARRPQ
jgi:hypothetical protein